MLRTQKKPLTRQNLIKIEADLNSSSFEAKKQAMLNLGCICNSIDKTNETFEGILNLAWLMFMASSVAEYVPGIYTPREMFRRIREHVIDYMAKQTPRTYELFFAVCEKYWDIILSKYNDKRGIDSLIKMLTPEIDSAIKNCKKITDKTILKKEKAAILKAQALIATAQARIKTLTSQIEVSKETKIESTIILERPVNQFIMNDTSTPITEDKKLETTSTTQSLILQLNASISQKSEENSIKTADDSDDYLDPFDLPEVPEEYLKDFGVEKSVQSVAEISDQTASKRAVGSL